MKTIKTRIKKQKRKTFKGILTKKLIATVIITTLALLVLSVLAYHILLYTATSSFYMEESYSIEAVT